MNSNASSIGQVKKLVILGDFLALCGAPGSYKAVAKKHGVTALLVNSIVRKAGF